LCRSYVWLNSSCTKEFASMSASFDTHHFDGIVPRSARVGGLALIAFATLAVVSAGVMTMVFGVTFSMSLAMDWRANIDLALWCLATLASVGLYLPARYRRWAAVIVLLSLPTAFALLVLRRREETALICFAALLLHVSIGLARTLFAQARLLTLPRVWIERRLLDRRCPRCLYDLRHLTEDRCPECGFAFGRCGL
jgi:hypothetical protein